MKARIAGLAVEVIGAENRKFTAPMLLVHGLWSTAAVWSRWTGFLAHRGWSCHAVDLRGRAGAPPARGLSEYEDDLSRIVLALGSPPVLVGHDLGALLALRVSAMARAVVALAPRLTRPYTQAPAAGLVRASALPGLLLGRHVGPPRGRLGRLYRGDLHLPAVAEPAQVLRALMRDEIPVAASRTPMLVMVGGRDPFVSDRAAADLAGRIGAVVEKDDEAGHALPVEVGWERRAAIAHRWIIQQLGDPLLALREESEEED